MLVCFGCVFGFRQTPAYKSNPNIITTKWAKIAAKYPYLSVVFENCTHC